MSVDACFYFGTLVRIFVSGTRVGARWCSVSGDVNYLSQLVTEDVVREHLFGETEEAFGWPHSVYTVLG
jgi:hypothetical protein